MCIRDRPGADRAVVFQGDDSLMPWLTASENILLGPRIQGKSKAEQEELADRLLNLVGLSGHGHKRPRELSGGMKQRIQIARVLANDPSMMLMDEPFAGVDAATETAIVTLLRELKDKGKTLIIVHHDLPTGFGLLHAKSWVVVPPRRVSGNRSRRDFRSQRRRS